MENNQKHGKGVLSNADGEIIYEGEWVNGEQGTEGPTCAICLDKGYLNDGAYQPVRFNDTPRCRSHIFHRRCAENPSAQICPVCRNPVPKILTPTPVDELQQFIGGKRKSKKSKRKSKKSKRKSKKSKKSKRKNRKTRRK